VSAQLPAHRGSDPRDSARIRRLLRWYPRPWRVRYGEEFAELLAAELDEQGPSWRGAANVAAAGLRARLADAGLSGHPLDPEAAGRAGLATVATCVAACVLAGGTMWAQVAVGLQWSVPRAGGITWAMALMSGALLLLAVLAVLAAGPVARAALGALGHARWLARRRPGAGSCRARRPVPARHPRSGETAAAGYRRPDRPRLPLRPVLPLPAPAVPGLPRPPPGLMTRPIPRCPSIDEPLMLL
jgi:hypothetical protein